jgi:UDP:flavonoid glycosyltransferase YjiC (YdhE family)
LTASGATIVFFPEGAFGPTNNCVGIGDVLRARRAHDEIHADFDEFCRAHGAPPLPRDDFIHETGSQTTRCSGK